MSKKSKAQKKSEKKIKKYYSEKESDVVQKAKTETERLQEDLQNIYKDTGIAQTRATEDYIRNIGNINANKAADVDDVNYYVKTMSGRTQEDLNTALAKEARRYSLESDQINQGLADTGMTFSDRTPEKIAAESSRLATEGINTEANRSFQDIARYEATKNRDIELKYGQLETEAGVSKQRSIEDVLNEQAKKALANQRGAQDIAFGKATDIRDISYGRDTDIATTGLLFDQQKALEKRNKMSGLT
jgi:hypothetical protein